MIDEAARLSRQGRIADAETVITRALGETGVPQAKALSRLATLRLMQGRQDEALALMREAVGCDQSDPALHSKLIGLMAYVEGTDTAALRDEQARWDRVHGIPHTAAAQTHAARGMTKRKLRVGYLGDDFGFGPIGRVVGGVIGAADRDAFEVFCYATVRGLDEASIGLAFNVDAWRFADRLDDDALAAVIRRDGIDILVDVSSHAGGNRLPVFTRRPAPVQISGWGFLPGAGISAIQALFTDETVVPGGERELFRERLFDLPCALGLRPWPMSPPEGPPPSATGAPVTFGCLNRVEKVSESVCAVWSDVLRAVEDSRLVLMDNAFADEAMRTRVMDRFTRRGVSPDRLTLLTRLPLQEYLAVYQGIDIALDPWPHSGGLTTLDALWMGVPVLTLPGQHALGRTSASILRVTGLPELIASDVQDYVVRAVDLARNAARRLELRATLRTRVRQSALCDAAAYARVVEDAYREAWKRWGPRV